MKSVFLVAAISLVPLSANAELPQASTPAGGLDLKELFIASVRYNSDLRCAELNDAFDRISAKIDVILTQASSITNPADTVLNSVKAALVRHTVALEENNARRIAMTDNMAGTTAFLTEVDVSLNCNAQAVPTEYIISDVTIKVSP